MSVDIALNAFRSQEAAVRGAHECHAMSVRASAQPSYPPKLADTAWSRCPPADASGFIARRSRIESALPWHTVCCGFRPSSFFCVPAQTRPLAVQRSDGTVAAHPTARTTNPVNLCGHSTSERRVRDFEVSARSTWPSTARRARW